VTHLLSKNTRPPPCRHHPSRCKSVASGEDFRLRNLIHNSNYQLVVYIHYVVFDIYDVSCVWKASQNTSTYGVLDKIQRQQSEETKAALSCLDIFCFQSIKYFLLSGMAVGARLVVLDNRHRSRPSDSSDGVWPVLPSHNSNTISDTGFSGSSQGIEDSHWARWQATRSQQSCSGVSPAAIPERAPVKSSPAKRTVTWLDLHQAQAQGSLATVRWARCCGAGGARVGPS